MRAFHLVFYNTINESFYNSRVCYIRAVEGIARTMPQ